MKIDNETEIDRTAQEGGAREVRRNSAGGFNRRVLVKGAAWSAPVLAASTAAPAFASSCEEEIGEFEATATSANLTNPAVAVSALVPAGATKMHFVVVGGAGGYSGDGIGMGAHIEGDMAVTAGQVYSLIAGAGGEAFGSGRGGKSQYGNGGNGTQNGSSYPGSGGGGASALVMGGTIVALAGGGGGSHSNMFPEGPLEGRYSSSNYEDTTATYGSSSVTAFGGAANGGWSGTGMAGETGMLGWMGDRASVNTPPTPTDIRLMSGGGRGGGTAANSPGAGGVPMWVSGPSDFEVQWSKNGVAGSGRNGGNGAVNSTVPAGSAGGGGGGYSGGGGGSSTSADYWGPSLDYQDYYGIGASGGGGSSYTNGTFLDLVANLDGRAVQSDDWGNMGYVRVTFFGC